MNKTQIALGVAVVALAYDAHVALQNRKTLARITDRCRKNKALADYYAQKLNDHNVPVNDFDHIIMNHLAR